MSEIRVGTSGWSYPSGRGTWNGIFYPVAPGASRRKGGFDELAFYAEHFETVEVNSSFYGIPSPRTVQSWIERTRPGFEFSLKLYQKFTHPDMFVEATGEDPADLGATDVDEFRRALDPLVTAGRLGALLAQFPPSFKNDSHARGYLEWLLGSFRQYPVAVELRDRSWSDDPSGTLALLGSFDAAWAQIDEPKFKFSIRQNLAANARTFYYMRLHGRNAAQWWRHEKSEDRYDYFYSDRELAPFADAAAAAAREVKKAYLYTNNHFSAKSVANAAMIKQHLGQPLDGAYPEPFVERYPELRGLVSVLPPSPSRA
ncbi:MAG TPA: DUF72 domain-containing protein [Vicinamibacterales bacterium]|nr:DUF72 domain-containing protein [Vicinamibacterales bacterium]